MIEGIVSGIVGVGILLQAAVPALHTYFSHTFKEVEYDIVKLKYITTTFSKIPLSMYITAGLPRAYLTLISAYPSAYPLISSYNYQMSNACMYALTALQQAVTLTF